MSGTPSTTRRPWTTTATDVTTVVEPPLLVATKDDGQATVVAGMAGHASRSPSPTPGPSSDADNVILADDVPAAFTAGSPSADLAGTARPRRQRDRLRRTPTSLAPGATWTISVPYGVGPSVPAQTVVNVATVTNDESFSGVTAADSTDVTESQTSA